MTKPWRQYSGEGQAEVHQGTRVDDPTGLPHSLGPPNSLDVGRTKLPRAPQGAAAALCQCANELGPGQFHGTGRDADWQVAEPDQRLQHGAGWWQWQGPLPGASSPTSAAAQHAGTQHGGDWLPPTHPDSRGKLADNTPAITAPTLPRRQSSPPHPGPSAGGQRGMRSHLTMVPFFMLSRTQCWPWDPSLSQ